MDNIYSLNGINNDGTIVTYFIFRATEEAMKKKVDENQNGRYGRELRFWGNILGDSVTHGDGTKEQGWTFVYGYDRFEKRKVDRGYIKCESCNGTGGSYGQCGICNATGKIRA